jgi:hypothetical protein
VASWYAAVIVKIPGINYLFLLNAKFGVAASRPADETM